MIICQQRTSIKKLKCASIDGFDAISVEVESTFTKGLPAFSIVGLGNSAIQESKDRIKSALLFNEFKFPPKKITINLSPSEIAKTGSQFDAPIALLIALQEQRVDFEDFYMFGELGLDGSFKDTKSIFVLALSLSRNKLIKNVLVPINSAQKLSIIPNINIYAVNNLNEAISFFQSNNKEQSRVKNTGFEFDFLEIHNKKYYFTKTFEFDFIDVKGQDVAKRAALISVCGSHNIIFEGNPGSGKSMISKRMRYILHPMSIDEILDKIKLDSIELKEPNFTPTRNFVSPHHTASKASIIGGTKIGEIGLSDGGLLFFDELPHFQKGIIEALREPLEDNIVAISRVNAKKLYNTKFLFVAAMNPCPCGNLLSTKKDCRCSLLDIQRYKSRLSEPFLDRIDLYVAMSEVAKTDKPSMNSKQMFDIVLRVFTTQLSRGQSELNGKLIDKDIEKHCHLDNIAQGIMDKAIENFNLTYRSIKKVQKVARTIADIEGKKDIDNSCLLEALSYRRR